MSSRKRRLDIELLEDRWTPATDTTPPVVFRGSTPDVTPASDLSVYRFTIVFTDDTGIDASTITSSAVRVTGPNGFSQFATVVAPENLTSGAPRTPLFQIVPPGGSWDASENGVYTISIVANTVKDLAGNPAPGGPLTTFRVRGLEYPLWVGLGLPLQVSEFVPTDTPDQAFIRKLYAEVLGRSPADGEIADGVQSLAARSHAEVVDGILNSNEFHSRAVSQMYRTFLHREADVTGLLGYSALLDAGARLEDVAADILASEEYATLHPSSRDFVGGLFLDGLGRSAEGDEAAFRYATALDGGSTNRREVATEVLRSEESRRFVLNRYYNQFLVRAPDDASLSAYAASGKEVLELAADLLASDEFPTVHQFDLPFRFR